MKSYRALRAAVLLGGLAAWGCTSVREIPRADYARVSERHGVRIVTRDGLIYDFDSATFSQDSLTGVRHRNDLEGPVDQTVTFSMALGDVERITTRRVDWARTGLVGGTMLAGVLVAGLGASAAKPPEPGGSSGGGKGGIN